jgi:hypothetical protein
MTMTHFTMENLIDKVSTWLTTGDLDPIIFSDEFKFISPFWQGNNKAEFLDKFSDPTQYKTVSLAKITHFDPIIPFKSLDGKHFSIALQYHTINGQSVYETVLGTINKKGLLSELRSIYDLEATKKALQLS